MTNLSVRRLSEEEFVKFKHEWNSLLERSVTNEVFLLWEWIYAWWGSFKDEHKELYILVGENPKGEIVGIAPFYKENHATVGLINRGVLKFCSASDTNPDHLDIICEKEYADLFIESVLEYLRRNGRDWAVIKLDGIGEDSFVKRYLEKKGEIIEDFIVDCVPDSECPYLAIKGGFEEYLKSFPRKKRYNLLRERKMLLEKVKLKSVQLGEDPDKDIKDLFLLHAERAAKKGIETTFCGEKTYNFHRMFINSLLEEGKIKILCVHEDSTPLASSYCMKHNNKYYYYQSGISSDGERKSAGAVLLSLLVEQAFDEGCNEFDFLRGAEEYKYYWTKDSRKIFSLILRKNDLEGRVRERLSAAFRRIRATKGIIEKNILGKG
jgi:CelD/BcsL family acetyltransferase involved in cellulose biosynthesis